MKILFLINSPLGSGGAERVVQTLANFYTNENNYDVTIVSLTKGENKYNLNEKVKFIGLNTGFLNKGIGKILSIPIQAIEFTKILKKEKPDYVMMLV